MSLFRRWLSLGYSLALVVLFPLCSFVGFDVIVYLLQLGRGPFGVSPVQFASGCVVVLWHGRGVSVSRLGSVGLLPLYHVGEYRSPVRSEPAVPHFGGARFR